MEQQQLLKETAEAIKLVSIRAENVMGCTLADVRLTDDALTIVGGNNHNGKSSFINAILFALGGKKAMPPDPIKHGEESADITLRLTGKEGSLLPWPCTVKREIKRDASGEGFKSYLTITADDGADAPSPQTLLNSLTSKGLGFDALSFVQQKPGEQVDTLKALVGLDFDDLDRKRQAAYDERTRVNRDVKNIQGAVKKMGIHGDVPKEKVSVSELAKTLREHVEHNANIAGCKAWITRLEDEISELESELKIKRATLEEADKKLGTLGNPFDDMLALDAQIDAAEENNRKIDENAKRLERIEEQKIKEREAKKLSDEITKIDREKKKRMTEADWPIPGLEFGEAGVYHDGVPLSQKSSAEQMEIAVSIALSLNPEFPFIVVWNGSLLDDESLAELGRIVQEKGGQCLVERVSKGSECHIVFEEGVGHVRS